MRSRVEKVYMLSWKKSKSFHLCLSILYLCTPIFFVLPLLLLWFAFSWKSHSLRSDHSCTLMAKSSFVSFRSLIACLCIDSATFFYKISCNPSTSLIIKPSHPFKSIMVHFICASVVPRSASVCSFGLTSTLKYLSRQLWYFIDRLFGGQYTID